MGNLTEADRKMLVSLGLPPKSPPLGTLEEDDEWRTWARTLTDDTVKSVARSLYEAVRAGPGYRQAEAHLAATILQYVWQAAGWRKIIVLSKECREKLEAVMNRLELRADGQDFGLMSLGSTGKNWFDER